MKPIYKPEALYKADINDLVEEDIAKGGVGSGIRGHKTAEKPSDPHSKQKIEMFESSLKAKKQVHAKFKKEKPGYKPGNPNHDMTEASIEKMTSKLKEMRGGKPKAAPKAAPEAKPDFPSVATVDGGIRAWLGDLKTSPRSTAYRGFYIVETNGKNSKNEPVYNVYDSSGVLQDIVSEPVEFINREIDSKKKPQN